MFHFKFIATFILLLLLAFPSVASAWDIVPGSGDGLCSFERYDICFNDFATGDLTSPLLDTRKCENWSAHFNSNIADTTYANTVVIRWSTATSISVNTSEIVNNSTLTGNPATGLDVLAGFDSPWIYAVATINDAGTSRVAFQCWKRRW